MAGVYLRAVGDTTPPHVRPHLRRWLGGLGLCTGLACSSDFDFLGPPPEASEHRWFAVREGRSEAWWIESLALEARPLTLPAESSILVLDYDVDPELPRDRRLGRSDFGAAGCAVMRPDRVWGAALDGVPDWETTELPDPLPSILASLAGTACHRCVRFEEERLIAETTTFIDAIEVLASGAAITWVAGVGAMRVAESAAHEFLPETGQFRTLGLLGDRSRSAAPFRGGFVIVSRLGSVLEHSNDAFCPVTTTLGNRSNHAARFLHAASNDGIYLDLADTTLSLIRPQPPTPPAEHLF